MGNLLPEVISIIESKDPMHAKKIRRDLKNLGTEYFPKANRFLIKFDQFLQGMDKNLDYGIECYLKMIADFRYEHLRFFETGHYSSKSFEEVNQRVYNNTEIMEYYMIGQLLSRFLMPHHYNTFAFFARELNKYGQNSSRYLEVGGGHGLFISEAMNVLGDGVAFDLLDISPSSIELSKKFIGSKKIHYITCDILAYDPEYRYNFITMGEVLEHVEQPELLLDKLLDLLEDEGTVYVTVPANAAAIDHIFLFRNAEEIRDMLKEAGFAIMDETSTYSENLSQEKAEAFKIPLMYGAFLRKTNK